MMSVPKMIKIKSNDNDYAAGNNGNDSNAVLLNCASWSEEQIVVNYSKSDIFRIHTFHLLLWHWWYLKNKYDRSAAQIIL